MTDISSPGATVHNRLGASARWDGERLTLELEPRPEVLHHGVVRTSVLAFLVDAVGAIPIDSDPDVWAFTTDMSVRARPVAAPAVVRATSTVMRRGRRSAACAVALVDGEGNDVASAAIGFTTLARRDGDPPKPTISPETAGRLIRSEGRLSAPLREEAGIEVVDATAGIVQVEVTPALSNPAGTLQGAMVALVAEAAAEELVASRADVPVVVADLDLRYLAQTKAGPVRTSARLLGDGPDAPIEVLLTDVSTGVVTTHAYARAVAPQP